MICERYVLQAAGARATGNIVSHCLLFFYLFVRSGITARYTTATDLQFGMWLTTWQNNLKDCIMPGFWNIENGIFDGHTRGLGHGKTHVDNVTESVVPKMKIFLFVIIATPCIITHV